MVEIIHAECKKCGASLDFPDDKEMGFCSYCGAKVILQRYQKQIVINKEDADNYYKLGKKEYEIENYEQALNYFERSLHNDADIHDPDNLIGKTYEKMARKCLDEYKKNLEKVNVLTFQLNQIKESIKSEKRRKRRDPNYVIRRDRFDPELLNRKENELIELNNSNDELRNKYINYFKKAGICPICGGKTICPYCKSSGKCVNCVGQGKKLIVFTCRLCKGSGACHYCKGSGKCPDCDGTGKYKKKE